MASVLVSETELLGLYLFEATEDTILVESYRMLSHSLQYTYRFQMKARQSNDQSQALLFATNFSGQDTDLSLS